MTTVAWLVPTAPAVLAAVALLLGRRLPGGPALLTLLGTSTAALAQTTPAAATTAKKGTETVQFKTSAVCDMCKSRIEKSMAYEKGVQAANLDVATKVLGLPRSY